MIPAFYFPLDEFTGINPPNLDLAADYLELKSAFSCYRTSHSRDIVDALETLAEEDYSDVNSEIEKREEIESDTLNRIASRKRALNESYPFDLDDRGQTIIFTADSPNLGQTAYLVSLILSNLRSHSPLLDSPDLHPSDEEMRQLRNYFQYFATAAVAAEIGGPAWSFGFPRPDRTGFIQKLSQIWAVLKDGNVRADSASPPAPKDDQVDIFAWREQLDGLPGFLLIAAQVATGKDWKDKPIRSHIDRTFPLRWFDRAPSTAMVPYHIVPFARPDELFRDDVLVLGNVMHRLRVPRRVSQAEVLVRDGTKIEAFDLLDNAKHLISKYLERTRLSQ